MNPFVLFLGMARAFCLSCLLLQAALFVRTRRSGGTISLRPLLHSGDDLVRSLRMCSAHKHGAVSADETTESAKAAVSISTPSTPRSR